MFDPKNRLTRFGFSRFSASRTSSIFSLDLLRWVLTLIGCLFSTTLIAQVEWQGEDPNNDDHNGDFHVGSNWVGGNVPDTDQIAQFDLPSQEFSVDFLQPGNFEVRRLYITNGQTTFDLDGEILDLNGADSGHSHAQPFTVSGGDPNFTLLNGTIDVASRGTIGLGGEIGHATIGSGALLQIAGDFLVGQEGTGFLTIRDGGTVEHPSRLFIGHRHGSQSGSVTVTGSGSRMAMRSLFAYRVDTEDDKVMSVLDGATVTVEGSFSGVTARFGPSSGHHAPVLISGNGSSLDLSGGGAVTFGNVDGESWVELKVVDGGQFTVTGGSDVAFRSNTLLHVSVTHDDMVQLSGDLQHDGDTEIFAAPTLGPGAATYTPISVGGTWTGSGGVTALGGIWDNTIFTFEVSERVTTSSGVPVTLDLQSTQRLQVTGGPGEELLVAFDPNATATGGGSGIDFEATALSLGTVGGEMVLAAWEIQTDLESAALTQLSMEIGAGFDVALLSVWHRPDGGNWSLFDTDLALDQAGFGTFLVEGFSSYAITIPEPSTSLLTLLAAGALLVLRRRRRE